MRAGVCNTGCGVPSGPPAPNSTAEMTPLPLAVLEFLDEQERAPAPDDRERIGVEPPAVVGQIGPAVAEPARAAAPLAAPPADAPVRRVEQRAHRRRATARASRFRRAALRASPRVERPRRRTRWRLAGQGRRRRRRGARRARLRSASPRVRACPRTSLLTSRRLPPPAAPPRSVPLGPRTRTVGARPRQRGGEQPRLQPGAVALHPPDPRTRPAAGSAGEVQDQIGRAAVGEPAERFRRESAREAPPRAKPNNSVSI